MSTPRYYGSQRSDGIKCRFMAQLSTVNRGVKVKENTHSGRELSMPSWRSIRRYAKSPRQSEWLPLDHPSP